MTSQPRTVPSAKKADARAAIVFVHGFALDARQWRRQVDAFGADYRVLTVDLPGFGPQAREGGDVRPAAEIARAMQVAGIERAHMVGSSYGGAVAIDFALQFPKQLASLTLASPLLLGRRTGIDAWSRCISLANEGDRATAIEVWLDDPLFAGIRSDEELYEEVRTIALDYGGGHWTGAVVAKWSDPDPAHRLGSIETPTLVVSGKNDTKSFVAMADAIAKAMPNARRAHIDGAAHYANMERAEAFNAALADFLKAKK